MPSIDTLGSYTTDKRLADIEQRLAQVEAYGANALALFGEVAARATPGPKGDKGDSGVGVPSVAVSEGVASAGKGALLDADGRLGGSLFTGAKGYANVAQAVFSAVPFPPPNDTLPPDLSSIAAEAALQVIQSTAESQATAIQHTVRGAGRKGFGEIYVKTYNDDPSSFSTPLLSGAEIRVVRYQGSTNGQTGHIALDIVRTDGPCQPATVGELPGRYNWYTGTGFANAFSPTYYGLGLAFSLNSKQQAYFPGAKNGRRRLAGLPTLAEFGVDFGGIVRIGAGGSDPGEAPLKLEVANSTLLTVPEVGALECDAAGNLYFTKADGVRYKITMVPA